MPPVKRPFIIEQQLGRRVTDPNTLEANRLYRVTFGKFTLNHAVPQGFFYNRGPPIARNLYFINRKTMAAFPGISIYRFLEPGTNRIYQLFFRWPRHLLEHLSRLVYQNLFPPGTFDQGINVWLNVRGYFDVITTRRIDRNRSL